MYGVEHSVQNRKNTKSGDATYEAGMAGYHEAVVRPVTTTDVGTTLPVPNIHKLLL